MEQAGTITNGWRWMFVVGAIPAFLSLLIWRRLKEPERWRALAASGKRERKLGSYGELFGNPNWLPTACGTLAIVAVILLIAFYPNPTLPKLQINFVLALLALGLGLATVLRGPGSPWRRRAVV